MADTAHLILAAVTVALMFAAMAFGAAAFGMWFRIYSSATIVILLYVPILALVTLATLLFPSWGILTLAVFGVLQMLLYPLGYCVLTVAYYDLRVRKEGFDLEVLAATLQPA